MDLEKTNYYEVLEVPVGASPQEIERAYIRAKNAYSNDSLAMYSLMTADECHQILNQIEEAYSILGFPEKRREYDRVRGFNSTTKNPFEDNAPPLTPEARPQVKINDFIDEVAIKPTESVRGEFHYENYGSLNQEAKVSKVQALKKFSLDYLSEQSMEQKIEQATDFTGAFLKEIREYKNVPMDRLVEMTRISRTHLTAIENDDLKKLPAEVYVRGFVSQLAKVLKLNPDLVATSYIHHIKRLKGTK
ncbi:MAG: helix-turn-helix domain-containing protein [Proteobacteria bacterium]|nr:helix-turn-helix domain-containing protein [Pseudomonadota bacterium]